MHNITIVLIIKCYLVITIKLSLIQTEIKMKKYIKCIITSIVLIHYF